MVTIEYMGNDTFNYAIGDKNIQLTDEELEYIYSRRFSEKTRYITNSFFGEIIEENKEVESCEN